MSSLSNSRNIVAVWSVIAVVVLFALFLFYGNRTVAPVGPSPAGEEQIVNDLITAWPVLEKTFAARPVLGSTKWNYPNVIQFLSEDKFLIEYDDGHILLYSVVERNREGNFAVLETLPNDRVSASERDALKDKYGRTDFEPITFVYSPDEPKSTAEVYDWKKGSDPFR